MSKMELKTIEVWFYSGQKRIFENIVEMAVMNQGQIRLTNSESRDILLNWNNINFVECQDKSQ